MVEHERELECSSPYAPYPGPRPNDPTLRGELNAFFAAGPVSLSVYLPVCLSLFFPLSLHLFLATSAPF